MPHAGKPHTPAHSEAHPVCARHQRVRHCTERTRFDVGRKRVLAGIERQGIASGRAPGKTSILQSRTRSLVARNPGSARSPSRRIPKKACSVRRHLQGVHGIHASPQNFPDPGGGVWSGPHRHPHADDRDFPQRGVASPGEITSERMRRGKGRHVPVRTPFGTVDAHADGSCPAFRITAESEHHSSQSVVLRFRAATTRPTPALSLVVQSHNATRRIPFPGRHRVSREFTSKKPATRPLTFLWKPTPLIIRMRA